MFKIREDDQFCPACLAEMVRRPVGAEWMAAALCASCDVAWVVQRRFARAKEVEVARVPLLEHRGQWQERKRYRAGERVDTEFGSHIALRDSLGVDPTRQPAEASPALNWVWVPVGWDEERALARKLNVAPVGPRSRPSGLAG